MARTVREKDKQHKLEMAAVVNEHKGELAVLRKQLKVSYSSIHTSSCPLRPLLTFLT